MREQWEDNEGGMKGAMRGQWGRNEGGMKGAMREQILNVKTN